ncbi:hypothetical protein D9M72_489330 [compost metagenome]
MKHQPGRVATAGVEVFHQPAAEDIEIEVQIEMADVLHIDDIGPDFHSRRDVGETLFAIVLHRPGAAGRKLDVAAAPALGIENDEHARIIGHVVTARQRLAFDIPDVGDDPVPFPAAQTAENLEAGDLVLHPWLERHQLPNARGNQRPRLDLIPSFFTHL